MHESPISALPNTDLHNAREKVLAAITADYCNVADTRPGFLHKSHQSYKILGSQILLAHNFLAINKRFSIILILQ